MILFYLNNNFLLENSLRLFFYSFIIIFFFFFYSRLASFKNLVATFFLAFSFFCNFVSSPENNMHIKYDFNFFFNFSYAYI